jgi:hypothetical protein
MILLGFDGFVIGMLVINWLSSLVQTGFEAELGRGLALFLLLPVGVLSGGLLLVYRSLLASGAD